MPRLFRSLSLFLVIALFAVPPVMAADAPTPAQARGALAVWCQYKNQERAKLEREADALFGIHPAVPPGQTPTQEMLSAHFLAREQWKEPRLEKLNAAFKVKTGLDFYATSRVVTEQKLYLECR